MKIFIVIPAYDESKRITKVVEELKETKLPLVIVDDGSSDNTFEICQKFTDKQIHLLHHRVNLGKGAALKTGCEAAFLLGAEAIVIMDSDGQHQVSDLPKFIKALNSKKYDLIFGARNFNSRVPLVRLLGNKMAVFTIYALFGIKVKDVLCGFRSFTKKAYLEIDFQSRGYGIETEMIVKTAMHSLKYCEVEVETIYYDKFKGVTVFDSMKILLNLFKWRIAR